MRKLASKSAWLSLALASLLAASACSGSKAARKGQIMLALQTDMSIPDDVTHVRILVFKNGALKFDQKYRVGKDGEEIPATLGIIASDNASDTTEVRVLSYQGATVRTLNRAVTTIPQDRIATLRIPIQWLCDGQVKPTEGIPDSYDSSCKSPDEACVAGECRKVKVDSATLPEFRSQEITGGAADPTRGLCFDTVPCLEPGRDLVPDADCTISVPPAEVNALNVGLRLAPGRAGICSQTGTCYIPLDRGDAGWQVVAGSTNPTRIQLPRAVCSKLASGDAQAVRVSSACVTKTEQNPTCGPWTSVGTQNPDTGPIGSGNNPPDMMPMPDPNSACPELYTNAQPVSSDPHVDHFGRLSVELNQAANRVRGDVGMACAGIVLRVTGQATTFASAIPTEQELESVCAAAQLALTGKQAEIAVTTSPGYCRADATEQLALEQGCQKITGCSFGAFSERCTSLLTSCDGACFGACLPSATMLNVACEGSCVGQCDGTCDGTCIGPGGNQLPSSDCLGQCSGSCSGTCQGNCMTNLACQGTCRGTCEGTVTQELCESPLSLPDCAMTDSCENLAAASAGMHQMCMPASVFVPGPTPPEVAPAISDNVPRLMQAILQARGFERASGYLDGAGRSLGPSVTTADSRCFGEASKLIGPASVSLGASLRAAETLVNSLGMASPPGPCTQSSADDSCAMCMKSSCCVEVTACADSANCQQETQCMQNCAARGPGMSCEAECAVNAGTLEPSSVAYLACQTGTCSQCNVPNDVCLVTGAQGAPIDDFEDGDLMTSLGGWHISNPNGFLGSLVNVMPGGGSSRMALGVAGSPDPGMSIDFGRCNDAVATGGIAFEATAQAASSAIPLTVRVRTRSTEPAALGGNCSTDCGDHFMTTLSLAPGAFGAYSLPWSMLLNSRALMPDMRQIVGLDFVSFGGSADQFAIDNVRFLPAP